MIITVLNKLKFTDNENPNLRVMPIDTDNCSYTSKYVYIYTQYQSHFSHTKTDANYHILPGSPIDQITVNVLHTNRLLTAEELKDEFYGYCIDPEYDTIRFTLECI